MSKKYCAKCGTKFIDDALFCDICGNKRAEKAPEVCSQCGIPIKEGASFCGSCGLNFSSGNNTANASVGIAPISQASMDNSWASIRQSLQIKKPAKKKTGSSNIILTIVLAVLIVAVGVALVALNL